MMNTSSRFAVLSPEVDLDCANRIRAIRAKQEKPKKENKPKPTRPTVPVSSKVQDKSQSKNKPNLTSSNKKKKSDDSDLQALAFGFGKGKNKKGGKTGPAVGKENQPVKKVAKKAKKGGSRPDGGDPNNHDDDWQKRDEEYVKTQNERSLREAILQSKLEFEEKKKVDDVKKIEKEKDKSNAVKSGSKTKKKKEKPITISLDQFQSLQPKQLANLRDQNPDPEPTKELPPPVQPQKFSEEKFFKDVEDATKKTLDKEHRQEQYKANISKVNHQIQVKKFISEIEKRDFEIQALRLEVDSLRSQMLAVKTRNKKLCEVISFSEMRSKGELVVELEKVTRGRDEFSEEIARLTAELEQERTKVSHLNTELKKLQGKKRNADSSAK